MCSELKFKGFLDKKTTIQNLDSTFEYLDPLISISVYGGV